MTEERSPVDSQDTTSTSLLLKVLRAGGQPPMASTQQRWSLPTRNDDGTWTPGDWWTVKGKIVPCRNGLHLCRVIDLPNWIRNADEIYIVEHDGQLIVHDDGTSVSKVVVTKARLIRRVDYSDTILRLWAADCAEHVLSIYEKRYPDDARPRKAIEAARAYVRGEIDRAALAEARQGAWKARSAADAAAADAAYAADAYDAAAYAAAAAAAAAYAAYAAYAADAARREEITWQAIALASLLNLPGYVFAAAASPAENTGEGAQP